MAPRGRPKKRPTPVSSGEPAAPPVPDGETERVAEELRAGADSSAPSPQAIRQREYRKRKKAEREAPPENPYAVEESDITATATAAAIVWQAAVVPFSKGRIRNLDADQEHRLGVALAPLVKKYLPLLDKWQIEVTAALVVIGVVRECYVPPPPKKEAQSDAAASVAIGQE